MKIAIAGKGGVGKTTISGILCRVFGQTGKSVLAIDGDPNPNLSRILGIDPNQVPPPNLSTDILERVEKADGTRKIIVKSPMEEVLNIYGQDAPDQVTLLKVGTPDVAGAGCMCGSHTCVREIIHTAMSADNDHVTLLDMEASMEHMRRGTAKHVDIMLTVVEPYYRSLEAAGRFASLSKELGISRVYAVANKVHNEREQEAVDQFCKNQGLELLITIPFDPNVGEADLIGKSIMDYKENSLIILKARELAELLSNIPIQVPLN